MFLPLFSLQGPAYTLNTIGLCRSNILLFIVFLGKISLIRLFPPFKLLSPAAGQKNLSYLKNSFFYAESVNSASLHPFRHLQEQIFPIV